MEDIIKKAIEGGYTGKNTLGMTNVDKKEILRFFSMPSLQAKLILDPLFWQSLGKACGWEEREWSVEFTGSPWFYVAIHFHEINLTEGWDKAVEYLQSIIK